MASKVWRAWYTEGRRFDSTSTKWENLPQNGMLALVIYLQAGKRLILQGSDYYWKSGPEFNCDDNMANIPDGVCEKFIKLGKEIPDDDWRRVYAEVLATREAPA